MPILSFHRLIILAVFSFALSRYIPLGNAAMLIIPLSASDRVVEMCLPLMLYMVIVVHVLQLTIIWSGET